jgi:hypothetical protein
MIIYLEAGYNLAGGDSTARVHHPVRQIYVAIPSVARSKAVSAVAYFGATGSRPRFWRQQGDHQRNTSWDRAMSSLCSDIHKKGSNGGWRTMSSLYHNVPGSRWPPSRAATYAMRMGGQWQPTARCFSLRSCNET